MNCVQTRASVCLNAATTNKLKNKIDHSKWPRHRWEKNNVTAGRGRPTKPNSTISFRFEFESFAYFVYKLQRDTCTVPPYMHCHTCRFRTCDIRRLLTLNIKLVAEAANECSSDFNIFTYCRCCCRRRRWTRSPPAENASHYMHRECRTQSAQQYECT